MMNTAANNVIGLPVKGLSIFLFVVFLVCTACSENIEPKEEHASDSNLMDVGIGDLDSLTDAGVFDANTDVSLQMDRDENTSPSDEVFVRNSDASSSSDSSTVNINDTGVDSGSIVDTEGTDVDSGSVVETKDTGLEEEAVDAQVVSLEYTDTIAGNDYQQVSLGFAHACAIKTDGTMACWGDNYQGRAVAPDGEYSQVSAGFDHVCALRTDGSIACWGGNRYGQATPPTGTYQQLSSGHDFSCALTDQGQMSCWGGLYGELSIISGSFSQISAADRYIHAIESDGHVWCWDPLVTSGSGMCDAYDVHYPKLYTQVSSGLYGICVMDTRGVTECWDNKTTWMPRVVSTPEAPYKQISVGSRYVYLLNTDGYLTCADRLSPNDECQVPPDGSYRQISAAHDRICAVTSEGTIICWKHNGTAEERVMPPSGVYTQVSLGANDTTCALRSDGQVDCTSSLSETMQFPDNCVQVSIGSQFGCAVTDDGEITVKYIINNPVSLTPFALPAPYSAISVGFGVGNILGDFFGNFFGDVCALTVDHKVTCREAFSAGFAWPGNTQYRPPYPDPFGSFDMISAGGSFNCGINSFGGIVCWSVRGSSYAPLGIYTQVAVGAYHACAIASDESAFCWGDNTFGQTEAISGTFTQLSSGNDHTCALTTDNRIVCWGDNGYGQLNPPDGSFSQISSFGSRICALNTEGRIVCWGEPTDVRKDY